MALITEDGTGMATAEALITVAFADAHLAARGMTTWATITSTEKEQAIRRATDYMGQAYRSRWAGYRVNAAQALDWPRVEVSRTDLPGYYDAASVPREVQQACAEMAFRAAAGELIADTEMQVTEKTIGPITTRYAAGASQAKKYPAVDRLLAPFLSGGGNSARLVRA